MTMIERVATAIKAEMGRQFKAVPLSGDTDSDDWTATGGSLDLRLVASAAIEAMRQPTEAMISEGADCFNLPHGGEGELSKNLFVAMIDAALKE